MAVQHPFPPLFDNKAQILILGSFPSVKSRETMFFYGHKQNRFWKVMAGTLGWDGEAIGIEDPEKIRVPESVEEKTRMLHAGHIALWDTIASCDIVGSSDSSITNVVPNDLLPILRGAPIRRIYCNGTKSYELFMKHTAPLIRAVPEFADMPFGKLPSTSPANAAWSVERLTKAWKDELLVSQ